MKGICGSVKKVENIVFLLIMVNILIYFNHSKNPNSLSAYYEDEEEVITKAIRDIQIGEEITDDYSTFEEGFNENNI
ncbi:SET domain-containing protein [Halarcobacter sp.]|uniref:SET domain-containing protein n=1 Tax=Halarcobacter sp. TaxID=2321133 RepID=UPI002AAB0966|nr:SET domain-containing protein [Halarcobacter sp.]